MHSASPEARFIAAAVPAINAARLLAVGSGLLPDAALIKSTSRRCAACVCMCVCLCESARCMCVGGLKLVMCYSAGQQPAAWLSPPP